MPQLWGQSVAFCFVSTKAAVHRKSLASLWIAALQSQAQSLERGEELVALKYFVPWLFIHNNNASKPVNLFFSKLLCCADLRSSHWGSFRIKPVLQILFKCINPATCSRYNTLPETDHVKYRLFIRNDVTMYNINLNYNIKRNNIIQVRSELTDHWHPAVSAIISFHHKMETLRPQLLLFYLFIFACFIWRGIRYITLRPKTSKRWRLKVKKNICDQPGFKRITLTGTEILFTFHAPLKTLQPIEKRRSGLLQPKAKHCIAHCRGCSNIIRC